MCETSNPGLSNRLDSYILEGQFPQATSSLPVSPSHIKFDVQDSRHQPNPGVQMMPQPYQTGNPPLRHEDMVSWNTQEAFSYVQGQRSMSVPPVPLERVSGGYAVVQGSQQASSDPVSEQQNTNNNPYNYRWIDES